MPGVWKETWDFDGEGEILLVDKPERWTSFDVVKRVRALFRVSKVGHAGTLDPLATGLLIVCTGKQTKNFDRLAGLEKEYTGTFILGIRTPSFDMDTEVTERHDYSGITAERLQEAARQFVGRQVQVPPMYSAAKRHGRPLYKYARHGKTVDRPPKEIEVSEFTILSFEPPTVSFRIVCSKGTYIRSIVDDVGSLLGCGASLASLRRMRIGPYSVGEAFSLEELEQLRDRIARHRHLVHENRLSS